MVSRLFQEFKPQKKRSSLKTIVRIGITVGLLFVVYGKADRIHLLKTFESFSMKDMLVLIALYAIGQALTAYRWRTFIEEANIHRPLDVIVRAYFFGMFVNIFGIGTVGGDVARALAIRPKKGERAAALATVVADRISGLVTLLFIGAVGLFFVRPAVLGWIAVPLSLAMVAGLAVFWFVGPRVLVKLLPPTHRFGEIARRIAQAFPSQAAPLLRITVISLVFHTLQIYMHVVMARVLGAPLSTAYLFATVPFINAAASLPLSIQGVGIRESLYVLFFTSEGVSREVAIAFGAIWLVSVTIVSAVGGLLLPPVVDNEEPEQTVEVNEPEANEETKKAVGLRGL